VRKGRAAAALIDVAPNKQEAGFGVMVVDSLMPRANVERCIQKKYVPSSTCLKGVYDGYGTIAVAGRTGHHGARFAW
jgi:hypothetical protein